MTGEIGKRDQYAFIAFLIKEAKTADQRLGKKALQKKVHLIQELGGVGAGYRFSFHIYGPYSEDLAGDLDLVAYGNGAKVSYNEGDNYYSITPGEETDRMIEAGQPFIDRNEAALENVLSVFGRRSAKELELVSTVAYLRRYLPGGEFDDQDGIVARVKALKPRYSDGEIRGAVAEVRGFLSP